MYSPTPTVIKNSLDIIGKRNPTLTRYYGDAPILMSIESQNIITAEIVDHDPHFTVIIVCPCNNLININASIYYIQYY